MDTERSFYRLGLWLFGLGIVGLSISSGLAASALADGHCGDALGAMVFAVIILGLLTVQVPVLRQLRAEILEHDRARADVDGRSL